MKRTNLTMLTGSILLTVLFTSCGSGPVVVNYEEPTSSIRAAEEVGAAKIPGASLYLQLAKEELEKAKMLASQGHKDQSESMLLRARTDAELAVALSRADADKAEAAKALDRVQKLRRDNQLLQERK